MINKQTADLHGTALDWAVAQAEGHKPLLQLADHLGSDGRLPYGFDLHHNLKLYYEVVDILAGKPHRSDLDASELRAFAADMGYVIDQPVCPPYSTDWALGGPIIERERIRLDCPWQDSYKAQHPNVAKKDGYTGWISGRSALEAAMRCYVSAKLGEEVDVPEELLK